MNIARYCQKIIEYSFYSLFFFVPLVFIGSTSELFEFNKMWLAYSLAIVIGVGWVTKMIVEKQLRVQRTPLDIFLLLFLASQAISTILSLDSWVSFWGYYSRFNGGLLSMITYVFLYYAFATNMGKQQTIRLIYATLLSGLVVALWGLPSHFGKDPTCLVFRGTLDVSCWTEAFRPTIRIFSTLGQPAWLAAFLAVLLPITGAFTLQLLPALPKKHNETVSPLAIGYVILSALFYLCLLYTNTRAGFLGFWVANIGFWGILFIKKLFPYKQLLTSFLLLTTCYLLLNFFVGTPVNQLNFLTLQNLRAKPQPPATQNQQQTNQSQTTSSQEQPNITDSGDIRKYVWQGAVDAWKANPVFGTGVETFAFAYYQHRPAGHNLTSEWDYLYNKAHNEYLNYLTTTGIVGLGTYLAFIGVFMFLTVKYMFRKHDLEQKTLLLVAALFAGFISILITNFFGFSVVIMNLFLFLIPVFVFLWTDALKPMHALAYPKLSENQTTKKSDSHVSLSQWTGITVITLLGLWGIYGLFVYWQADKAYALGSNLSHAGELQQAYPLLQQAVDMKPSEPIYKDEFSMVSAQVAQGFLAQQNATESAKFAQQAVALNAEVLTKHPNNLVFWKTRIRILYTLGQLDEQYLAYALQAAQKASELAPTDAKVLYNLGVLYGQTGNPQKAVDILTKTIELKPDYQDAYFALGLFYRDLAIDANGVVVKPEMQEKAEKALNYVLQVDPQNEQAKSTLADWEKQ